MQFFYILVNCLDILIYSLSFYISNKFILFFSTYIPWHFKFTCLEENDPYLEIGFEYDKNNVNFAKLKPAN